MYNLRIVVDDLTIVEVTSSRFEQIQAVQDRLVGLARDFETEAFQKMLSLLDGVSDKKDTQQPVNALTEKGLPAKKRGRPAGSAKKTQ